MSDILEMDEMMCTGIIIIYLIHTQYGIQDIYIEKVQKHKQQIDIIADDSIQ